ncbi:MAG: hypothetical protein V7644_1389 [Actinomycetota bacterium]|jgi:hypothetical protein
MATPATAELGAEARRRQQKYLLGDVEWAGRDSRIGAA